MNNVAQFLHDSKQALTSHDDCNSEKYVNTDSFGATEKFNDIWNKAQETLMNKYQLPAFHLWETGYCQGDATNDELFEAVKSINEVEYNAGANEANMGTSYAPTVRAEYDDEDELYTDVFEFLDAQLLAAIKQPVETLIAEYNEFCKNELSE